MTLFKFGAWIWDFNTPGFGEWWHNRRYELIPKYLKLEANRYFWSFTNTPEGISIQAYTVVPSNPNGRKVA